MVKKSALLLSTAAGVPLIALALIAQPGQPADAFGWARQAACHAGWQAHCVPASDDTAGIEAIAALGGDPWTDPPPDDALATLPAGAHDRAHSPSGSGYADVPADPGERAVAVADVRGDLGTNARPAPAALTPTPGRQNAASPEAVAKVAGANAAAVLALGAVQDERQALSSRASAASGDQPFPETTASISLPSATRGGAARPVSPSRQTASLAAGDLSLPASDGLSSFAAPAEVSPPLAVPLPPVRPPQTKQAGSPAPALAARTAPPMSPSQKGLGPVPKKQTLRTAQPSGATAVGQSMSRDVAAASGFNPSMQPGERALLPRRLQPVNEPEWGARIVVPLPARLLPDFDEAEELE